MKTAVINNKNTSLKFFLTTFGENLGLKNSEYKISIIEKNIAF